MGTRGLTMVVKDEKPVVAQYGQWDHYPSGQGATALSFVSTSGNVDKLENALDRVKYVTPEEVETKAILSGHFPDWPRVSYFDTEFDKLFPYLSRDHGAKILAMIANSTDDVELQDQSSFAEDSLFCEYAYVVDLDKRTFEVYEGFQTSPNKGRFANDAPTYKEYYPVTEMAVWSLDALPTLEEFLGKLEPENEDDE